MPTSVTVVARARVLHTSGTICTDATKLLWIRDEEDNSYNYRSPTYNSVNSA